MAKTVQPTRLRDIALPGGFDVLKMSPDQIIVEKLHNPRLFDTPRMIEKIAEMKTSIAAHGVLVPLLVRYDAGTCVLVDGETRLRAVRELNDETPGMIFSVPVMSVKANDEAERLRISLTANTGEPLTQLEHGQAFTRLVGLGWTAVDIAQKIGYTERYVNDALSLFDSPKVVKQLVAENKITPGRAIAEVKKKGTAAAVTLVAEVAKHEASKPSGSAKPLAREKAPAKNPLRDVVLAIAKAIRADVEKMDAEGEKFDWVEVPTKLARKLLAVAAEV
jgi:ParB/RepB/Spo0J family partition protein